MKRGLVVEDQRDARRWALDALREAFPTITACGAATLGEARRAIDAGRPDICLVDLELPDGSGVDLIRELRAADGDCLIIVSTLFADDRHLFPALRAGAQGYVLKDDARERMAALLRRAAAGDPPLSAAIARRLLSSYAEPAPSTASELSDREREVLVLAAKGYTLQQLGTALDISRNTASFHLKNVYRKLGIGSRAEAALEASRLGLIDA